MILIGDFDHTKYISTNHRLLGSVHSIYRTNVNNNNTKLIRNDIFLVMHQSETPINLCIDRTTCFTSSFHHLRCLSQFVSKTFFVPLQVVTIRQQSTTIIIEASSSTWSSGGDEMLTISISLLIYI